MSTSLSSAKAEVREFRASHGDPVTWDSVDFEVHQNLALVARHARRERLRRPLRRMHAIAQTLYAAPLYLLAEVLHAARGRVWLPLEHYLDRIDDRLSDIEDACARAGDQVFIERVGAMTDRFTDAADRIIARFFRTA